MIHTWKFLMSMLVLSSLCFAQTDTLTVLFASDTHSNLAPIGARSDDLQGTTGGIARAATIIGMTKMTEPNVLTLHAGDLFVGDIFYNAYFGIAEIKIMNAIGYDVLTLGNHEFDLGPKMLQMALDSSMTQSAMSIVSSNIILADNQDLHLKQYILPYTVRQFGTAKVGIFGLTTPQTNEVSSPSPVCFDGKCCECALATVQTLQQLGCSFIICLSHLGVNNDEMLAKTVPGLDLIISSHDHVSKDIKGYPNPSGKTTWVSQTDAFYTEMGKVQILITQQTTELLAAAHIPLDGSVAEEPTVKSEVDKLIAGIEQQFGPMFSKTVTYATDDFSETSVYQSGDGPKETAIGNIVTDAFRFYAKTDIAIEPGGSTAQPLYKGQIVGDDLFRVVGYGFNEKNSLGFRLATFTITGESLAIALEKCVATIETNDEFFPQVSGMQFSYCPKAPVGTRVLEIMINGEPLDPLKRYSVATNEFAVTLLTTIMEINISDLLVFEDMTEYQALLRYVSHETAISPTIEGRIKIIPLTALQLAGEYTIGKTGTFTSLESAFATMTSNGIRGAVTLMLTDTLYDITKEASGSLKMTGPISGAGPASRITIRPADNAAVTIKGNGKGVLEFNNVSYCTIDGIGGAGNTRLNVQALSNPAYANNSAILFRGNSDFNEIKNLTAGSSDVGRVNSCGVSLMTDSTGTPDHCTISGITVTSGETGIMVWGTKEMQTRGNIIQSNQIGTPTNNQIAFGIVLVQDEGSLVEYNHIENLRRTSVGAQIGIDIESSRNTIVRNNIVHNLLLADLPATIGIGISALSNLGPGSNVRIYNNKVWDIKTVKSSCRIRGIIAANQDSLRIDNNTICLTESDDANASVGSSGIQIEANNFNTFIRNNIVINTRDDIPGISTAIKLLAPIAMSDHNDLFVGTGEGAFIGFLNSECKTLDDWKTTGYDQHSLSMMPPFNRMDLHIDTTNTLANALDGMGIPVTGILYDFQGQLRNATYPDIGADEFDKVTGVTKEIAGIPETFSLSQNYPNPFNPSTSIRYALPFSANVELAVYDMLGRKIATLVDEEQTAGWKESVWNTNGVSSGIYFYRLHAGPYQETKRMSLIK